MSRTSPACIAVRRRSWRRTSMRASTSTRRMMSGGSADEDASGTGDGFARADGGREPAARDTTLAMDGTPFLSMVVHLAGGNVAEHAALTAWPRRGILT